MSCNRYFPTCINFKRSSLYFGGNVLLQLGRKVCGKQFNQCLGRSQRTHETLLRPLTSQSLFHLVLLSGTTHPASPQHHSLEQPPRLPTLFELFPLRLLFLLSVTGRWWQLQLLPIWPPKCFLLLFHSPLANCHPQLFRSQDLPFLPSPDRVSDICEMGPPLCWDSCFCTFHIVIWPCGPAQYVKGLESVCNVPTSP